MDREPGEQLDLFEDPSPTRRPQRRGGYAATPGTGPAGRTCGDCACYRSVLSGARKYRKCALCEPNWTRGPGSDILKRSPACVLFAERTT